MRFVFACFAALLLAGCANSSLGSLGGSLGGSSTVARPKTIIVTDFAFGPDVTAVDRAYTARLERKIGSFPPHERKPRTLERVNEEIVATIVATLRGAGLQAQPGGADAGGEGTVLISGEIKTTETVVNDVRRPKPVTEQIGFGAGRSNFAADVKVLSGGKRQLTSFTVDAGGGRGAPAGNAKQAAAQNAAIATALAEQKAAPEKLSPDTEGQARRIGRNAAEKILAYAKEQGWLEAPAEVAEVKQ
jgi:hypothetical protein